MKFYELKKGQRFRFPAEDGEPAIEAVSAGVDGVCGRFVMPNDAAAWHEPHRWHYCRPLDDVEMIE